jgi:plastocyanin
VRRWAITAAAVALLGCGGQQAPASEAAVGINDFAFAPATVHVRVGGTVDWRNGGTTQHSVKGPRFFSKALEPGERRSFRFDTAGTYDYFCTLHPDQMRGRVVVER